MVIVIKHCDVHSYKDCYIKKYGYHFNNKLCKYAISLMHHSDKSNNLSWEQVMSMLERYKIQLDTSHPYDIYYVANMGYHDFYKSSIKDEEHLAQFIQDYLDDEDGYEGVSFCRWLADIKHKSIEIDWSAMI